MRLVISFIVETEDTEDLVVLLAIRIIRNTYGLALSSIHLEIRSCRHEALRSNLECTSISAKTLSERYGLCGEHSKRFLRE